MNIEELSMDQESGSQIQFLGTLFKEAQSKVHQIHTDKVVPVSHLADSEIPLYQS